MDGSFDPRRQTAIVDQMILPRLQEIVCSSNVIIGCSWSKDGTWHGYKWELGKTYCWVQLLAQDLREDWQVINVSMNGSSNAMIPIPLKDCPETLMMLTCLYCIIRPESNVY